MYAPQINPQAPQLNGGPPRGPLGMNGPGSPNSPIVPAHTPGTKGVNDAAAKDAGAKVDTPACVKHDAVPFPRQSALDAIRAHEGYTNYMYLDTKSLITIGTGWNLMAGGDSVAPSDAAASLPWVERATGKPPADPAKSLQAAWTALRNISSYETAQAKPYTYFKDKTNLYVDDSKPDNPLAARFAKHIADFTVDLHGIFKDFDSFPVPAREALLDMVMMGAGREGRAAVAADPKHHRKGHRARRATGLRQYSQLRAAAEKHDWKKASEVCDRKGVSKDRNNWTRNQFLEAVGWECAKAG